MRLWLLRPVADAGGRPLPKEWADWYDRTFGFVVRAETEADAREQVSDQRHAQAHDFANVEPLGWGREVGFWSDFVDDEGPALTPESCVWLDPARTTCVELSSDGPAEVVLTDHRPA